MLRRSLSKLLLLHIVKFVLCGIAIAIPFLLSSCSIPPPKEEIATRPQHSRIVQNQRTQQQLKEYTKKPAVTDIEVPAPIPHRSVVRPYHRLDGYKNELSRVANSTKIALTFDAGASPAPTPSILKTLGAAGVHVTFFVTGKWCEQNPELVREISEEGHEIGNHTFSHPDLRKLDDDAIVKQLDETEDIVIHLTGKSTKPLFRPPFGGRDKRVLSVAGNVGYSSVYWSLDSWDAFKKGITSEEIENRILDRVQGGDIVLMHCGSAPTATMLPDLIQKLRQRNYRIVKVSELMNSVAVRP